MDNMSNTPLATLPDDVALACSLNVLVHGETDPDKTCGHVKPNMMQIINGDFLVVGSDVDMAMDLEPWLVEQGYSVRVFDTSVPARSLVYNPLAYVQTDAEIASFVNMLIATTNGDKMQSAAPFWDNAESALLTALITLMRDYMPPEDYHLGTLVRLMGLADAPEDDGGAKSGLDCIFEEIATGMAFPKDAEPCDKPCMVPTSKRRRDGKNPYYDGHAKTGNGEMHGFLPEEDFALENYANFKKAAGNTLKSIIVSVNVRLAPLTWNGMLRLVSGPDQMHLDQLGVEADLEDGEEAEKEPTRNAIICIYRSTDHRTYGFLHRILVRQAVSILREKASRAHGDKLPRAVNLVLSEPGPLDLPADIFGMASIARPLPHGPETAVEMIARAREAQKLERNRSNGSVAIGSRYMRTR